MPSPKIIVREFDFSQYLQPLVDFSIGVVGVASRGPINKKTLITSIDQLIQFFGPPSVPDQYPAILGLYQYLKLGRLVWFVRVAGITAATATVSVPASDSSVSMTISGIEVGTYFNQYRVDITDAGSGKYNLYIINTTTHKIMESWKGVDNTIVVSTINNNSKYISIELGTAIPVFGSYRLSGGNDGLTNPDYIGETLDGVRTGLQIFRPAEETDIWALCVPGNIAEEVQTELIDIVSTRKDCVTFLDTPYGIGVQNAVDFANGEGDYVGRVILQSSYATAEFGWSRVYNPYTDKSEYIPPCIGRLYAATMTVQDYQIWFAMAGARRGRLDWSMGVEYNADEGERDYMYAVGSNAINPTIDYPGYGTMIFGQKTLARSVSHLDELNVRFLLIYIRRGMKKLAIPLLMEPNDEFLWNEFLYIVRPFLVNVQNRQGLNDFLAVCDKSTNPDQNTTMYAKLLLKPTSAAEVIVIDMNILRNDANFNEYVGTGAEIEQFS
jgi:hypothetical protein